MSLYIVRLTREDFEHFQAEPFLYSASTGYYPPHQAKELYPGFGCYIATYIEQLENVIHSLKWKHVSLITFQGNYYLSKESKENARTELVNDIKHGRKHARAAYESSGRHSAPVAPEI